MRLTVLIEGINLEKLLRAAQEEGIVLFDAKRMDVRAMQVSLTPGSKRRLEALCEKSGWQMREVRADAALRMTRFLKRRLGLVAAFLCCLLLVYASSQMILSVSIEHAQENAAEVRRFLDEMGVRPGRLKRSFSLDDLREKLTFRLPGLSFASFRYAGSTLIADCRPSIQGEAFLISGSALDIVAAQPGIVSRISVSSGTPQVEPGQAVRRGQVLIKGEERTEKGQMRPVQAQGQVLARVFSGGSARVSLKETRTVETGQIRTRVTVCSPWHARTLREAEPFESQDVSTEIQPVVGLYIPLWREKQTYAQTVVFTEERNPGDAASMAQAAAEEQAKKGCPHGALILDKWVEYDMPEDGTIAATVVLEYETGIAGREKPAQ